MRKANPGDGGIEADNVSKATTACEALMVQRRVAGDELQCFQGLCHDTSSPPGEGNGHDGVEMEVGGGIQV